MSLPKQEPVNDLIIGIRFYDMTGGVHPADRPDDSFWFRSELLRGSLIAYYRKRDEYEVLIDGEQIDDP